MSKQNEIPQKENIASKYKDIKTNNNTDVPCNQILYPSTTMIHQIPQPLRTTMLIQEGRLHGNQHVQRLVASTQYQLMDNGYIALYRQKLALQERKKKQFLYIISPGFKELGEMFLDISINNIINKIIDITNKYVDKKYNTNGKEAFRPHITRILNEAVSQNVNSYDHLAYILATSLHESKMGMLMTEKGSKNYTKKYKGLPGNKTEDDAYNYRGRGYIHSTGKGTYEKDQGILKEKFNIDKDLVNKPDLLAQDPDIASKLMVYGMMNGTYTGVGLSKYNKKDGSFDFINARRVVNGTNEAQKIADYAKEYLPALKGS